MIEVVEPATEQVMAEVPRAGVEEVDAAVARAKQAFPAWRAVAPPDRATLLRLLADALEEQSESLATLEARNVGKPIGDARAEIAMVVETFRYYAAAPERLLGQTIPVAGGIDMTFREPLGVVGLIVPWNFPLVIASWKMAPALAAGNTVVLKPAELTPLTALELEKTALEAGIPEGVLNVVAGPGSVCGSRLVEHPDVAKIAFTGSTEVGRTIGRSAAGTIKRVTLELGGKSANVIFADADLERFARESPYSVFDNCGQDCCARSRILVERSAHDKVVELFAAATKNVKVGDPADDATEVGTLVSFKQRDRVMEYVEAGKAEGAELVAGGTIPDDAAFADGAYLMPTIFDNVRNDMRIAREEIFGPVVSIIPFDSEADAIRLANETPYGLSGSIWSRDIGRALRTAKGVQAGVLSVNSNNSVHTEAPFGGYKMSGIGRELGMHAIELYTELKNVYVDIT